MVAKKQEEEEFDDFDEEEEFNEDDEDNPPRIQAPPKVSVNKSNKLNQPKPSVEIPNRYSSYHQSTIDGIMDNKTGKLLTADLWEALTMILNSQERMEEKLG